MVASRREPPYQLLTVSLSVYYASKTSSSRTFGERRTEVSRYIHTTRRLLSQLLVVVELVRSKPDVLVALADTRQMIQRRQAEVSNDDDNDDDDDDGDYDNDEAER